MPASSNDNSGRVIRWAAAALAAVVLCAYGNSLSGAMLFDDFPNIIDNPAVKDLDSACAELPRELRPLPMLSLALNRAAGGLDVFGYHLVNVSVHIAAGLALFGVVRRTLQLPACGGFGGTGTAFSIALLWALHPIQTESVTYIVQRAQSMMGLCFLLTLYGLVRNVDSSRPRRWSLAAIAACVAGMAGKQDMVVAPIAALAFDRIFLAGSWRGVLRSRGWLHAGLFTTWIVLAPSIRFATSPAETASASQGPDDRSGITAGFGMNRTTPVQYALTQPGVIVHYIGLSVWPQPLCFDYLDWPVVKSAGDAAAPILLVTLLVAATGMLLWFRPCIGFLPFLFFLTLAPTSSILPILDVAAERRLYLPLAAEVALVVLAWRRLGDWLVEQRALKARNRPQFDGAALAIAALALGIATRERNEDYRSAVAMWESVVAARPDNPRAQHNLAGALAEEGRRTEAIDHFLTACRLKPDSAKHAMLADTLHDDGQFEAAIHHYRRAIAIYPEAPGILLGTLDRIEFNLGRTFADLGRWDEAEVHFAESVRLKPDAALPRVNLGRARVNLGRIEEGIAELEEVVRRDPESAAAHVQLGIALVRIREFDRAIRHLERAAVVKPDDPNAIDELGTALFKKGDVAASASRHREALDRQPSNGRFAFDLAHVLVALGKQNSARELYRAAVQAEPGRPRGIAARSWRLSTNADTRRNDSAEAVRLAEQAVEATERCDPLCLQALAAAYASAGRFPEAAEEARAEIALLEKFDARAAEAAQSRLRTYERGEPHREAAPPKAP